jgi:hypothetical protein
MKFISTLILISCFYLNPSFSQNKEESFAIIKSKMKEQEKLWNTGDINGFMDFYWKSDSLKFIGKNGITYGWKKTIDNYIKSYPTKQEMGDLFFTILECSSLSNETIFIIGKWELKKEKPIGGYFTLLWKKINNEWVIIVDHTS